MKIADLPAKFPIPFAADAGSGFIRAIPEASQIGITPGAASLTDGFPPVTFQPVGAGGTPPWGQDMNGIINQITLWSQWQNAGGLVPYDGTFSTAIGGYPKSAVLAGATTGQIWLNTVDDNTTNPNSGGAGWLLVPTALGVLNQQYSSAVDTGTATALVVTLSPAPTAYTKFMTFDVQVANTATGPATINVNGLGNVNVTDLNAAAITPGFWQAGNFLQMLCDGTNVRVVGGNRSVTAPFSVTNAATQGLANNILAQVNFASTGGSTSFGSYTTSNFTFSRAGSYFVSGSVTTSVTISGASNIASSVQLRQNGGAVPGASSGDGNYAPGATTTGATQYYGGIVNAAASDVLSLFASSGASANYSSSNVSNVLFAITLIN
ncbi:hypothetical protein [Rhizobium rhizogenes]|uniref:hypothetical protein n=1 Tax=Rhizobium rhizogenes TaxID=359 RepID=UPI00226FACC0|nr:hypothetical protein [Rhizobium rhizogenes]